MKRGISLFMILVLALGCWAQTQQGVVKTRGKMVNGKLVPGVGLSGATVTIQGRNAVQSQTNGAFSFPIPSKTFMLLSAQKQGYQLVDADATRKAYQYSPNIFYIVMETPEQQQADKVAAERKLRRTLQQQLQQREDEIDAMKVSLEEKNRLLAELYKQQENNEKLIADMAQEYAQMDYDQMDELNRQISDAILNGELTKADSLLRSKGDMNSRNAEITRRLEAEAKEKKELAERERNLAASEEGTRKLLEDYAEDCYNYFKMYKLENKHDSAAYYIELRANRDTTNAEWQFDAASYLQEQNQFREARSYYERALNLYQRLAVSTPQAYEPDVAATLNNLAILYDDTQRFTESEQMYKEALEIRQRLAQANPQAYEPDVAMTLNNLAVLYKNTQRFTESEQMYKEALEIRQRLAQANPQAYEPDVAATLNNLAILYSNTQRLSESEQMYKEALEILQRLALANPQAYEPDVAMTLNNLAALYDDTQKYTESEQMYKEALEISQRLAQANPQAYEPYVATTLNNLAILYFNTQRFSESEQMYKESLEIYQRLAQANPQAYEPDVAQTQYNIGLLKVGQEQYADAIPPFEGALEIYRRVAKVNPAQQQWYVISLYYLSFLYSATNNPIKAYQINQEWIPISKEMYEASPEELRGEYASKLGSQSFCAIFMKQYTESEKLAREGLLVDSTQHFIYSNLAAALLFQGKYSEAEAIYRQYKDEMKESFLNDFKQYTEAGVIPPEYEADVEKIKRMLEEE
mgnify:CR=1 FL=1